MMIIEIAKFNGTEACYSEQAKKVSPSPAQTQKKRIFPPLDHT